MFGIFSEDKSGPVTDREEVIKILQMLSKGDELEFKPKFCARKRLTVQDTSGRKIKLSGSDGSTTRYIDTQTGMLTVSDEGLEFGIEKIWPSDSMREMLGQMVE